MDKTNLKRTPLGGFACTASDESATEYFAWAAFADNGNVIIWSRQRSQVEPVAAKYGKPVVPVIALPAGAEGAESGQTLTKHLAGALLTNEPVYLAMDVDLLAAHQAATNTPSFQKLDLTDYSKPVVYANSTAAPASAQPVADDLRTDYQADSHYLNGLRAGWNLGVAGDDAKFDAIVATRGDQLREARRELRDAAQPVAAAPAGWVALSIIYNDEMEHPEEVAYGPKIMMDRLGKWLDKFMAQEIAQRDEAEDAARYRYIATLMDWSDIERMCWSTSAGTAEEFKHGLDEYIDGKLKTLSSDHAECIERISRAAPAAPVAQACAHSWHDFGHTPDGVNRAYCGKCKAMAITGAEEVAPVVQATTASAGDERAGWEAAAKELRVRAQAHHKQGNFDLYDECMQCSAMLNDLKPASKASTLAQHGASHGEKAAEVWHPIETMPTCKFVICAAEMDGPGDWRMKMGHKAENGRITLLGGSWEPTRWIHMPPPPGADRTAAVGAGGQHG